MFHCLIVEVIPPIWGLHLRQSAAYRLRASAIFARRLRGNFDKFAIGVLLDILSTRIENNSRYLTGS